MLRLTMGAAVRVTGRLVSSPSAGQSHEIVVDEKSQGDVVVLGDCDTEVLNFPSREYYPLIFRIDLPHSKKGPLCRIFTRPSTF
jgi:aspartyl/asparaginyl-tRNA synthetase